MEQRRNGRSGRVGEVITAGYCKVSTSAEKIEKRNRQVDTFIKKPSDTKPIVLHFSQRKIAVSSAVTGFVRFLPHCESVNLMLRNAMYLRKSVNLTS